MSLIPGFNFLVPTLGQKLALKGPHGANLALYIREFFQEAAKPILIITPDTKSALNLESELQSLIPEEQVWYFPDWETLPYDTFSPYQDIVSRRLEILAKLPTSAHAITIAATSTILSKLAPVSYVQARSMVIKTGDIIELNTLKENLVKVGYSLTKQVLEHGEFSVRGSIVDIFPMGSGTPFRIDLFDNEVDSLFIIDPETQRSIKKIAQIRMLPAHEFPTDNEAINLFRKRYREVFNPSDLTLHTVYKRISEQVLPAGIEYYLPLFFAPDETATIFDYLPANTIMMETANFTEAVTPFYEDASERSRRWAHNPEHPTLPLKDLFLAPDEAASHLNSFPLVKFYPDSLAAAAPTKAITTTDKPLPPIAYNRSLHNPIAPLLEFVQTHPQRILFAVSGSGRREIVTEMLGQELPVKPINSVDEFLALPAQERGAFITVAPFINGTLDENYIIITESELLGSSYTARAKKSRARVINPDAVIKNLAELSPGEFIVHEQYGIGEFTGLETMKIDGINGEYVTLRYAEDAKMYVPITSLHLLSRYTGAEHPALTRLGTDAWKKARKKAAEKIKDVAAGLLEIYAKRKLRAGFQYKINQTEYARFASGFGYQPTEDQETAIKAVLADMQSTKPMDRLICGDVGFGKTEVAMRAAFVAVDNGKQVAILVPTTLLADQHYENFRERFADTAIEIACLSRFKSAKEQQQILNETASGKIDIIIGTHKLLSTGMKFKDLGLLVVDEEHRFGVSQKEKIKKLRADVDILTMTATPIPRTLNLAMNSVRDLSIIATPPAKRLAVRTFVHEWSDDLIREAVLRELKRGGQCYFLHNDVESINRRADELQALVPEARIGVAHAQLPEKDLARIMHDFYHQRFNLLVCSTIIETGIDVPTANTILIERADKFGLAQLHQLRGRVGRSHHQAYAFLLTPPENSLSSDAKKRLAAISKLEELGSGFILATQDLEIRGAGEILGAEQSGQIQTIGFGLYMEMLEAAVRTLQEGQELTDDALESNDISIEYHIPVLFPENYIYDITGRLTLYKRLASCLSADELNDLKAEIIDRFGPLPPEATNLFAVSAQKLIARRLGIEAITMQAKGGSITFGPHVHVKFDYLTGLITEHPELYRLDGANRIKILKTTESAQERLNFTRALLDGMNQNYEKN